MISTLENNIKQFVQENRTSHALALLLEASKPNKPVHEAIHVVLGEFNDLTAQRLRGTIEDPEATLKLNAIHNKILGALSAFDSEGNPLPGKIPYVSKLTPKPLAKLGLFLMGGAMMVFGVGYVLKAVLPDNIGGGKLGLFIAGAGAYLALGSVCVLGVWLFSLIIARFTARYPF